MVIANISHNYYQPIVISEDLIANNDGDFFVDIKAVFHSIISPPPAKNFDIEIIFYIHASLKKFVLLVQSLNIFIFCLTFR